MAKKKKKNYIPFKNYVIAALIVLAICLGIVYIFKWFNVYKTNKLSVSYLIETKTITNEITSLENTKEIFSESPNDYFVYISYTNDEDIYNMEKELKTIVDDYNLNSQFYYINVTEYKDKTNYIDQINEALNLYDNVITKVPTIVYVEDNHVSADNIIKREDNQLMSADDFQQLLDIKGFKKA